MSESYFSHKNNEYLSCWFVYDSDSGEIRWKRNQGTRAIAGELAGVKCARGYLVIGFNGKKIAAHRVAWSLHHGKWPDDNLQIDHINRDKTDNRIENLRLCTPAQNSWNKGKTERATLTTGSDYAGVTLREDGLYSAFLHINGKRKKIGVYKTPEEAAMARDAAALQHRGEFAYLNFQQR